MVAYFEQNIYVFEWCDSNTLNLYSFQFMKTNKAMNQLFKKTQYLLLKWS